MGTSARQWSKWRGFFDPPWLDNIEIPGSPTPPDSSKENIPNLPDENIEPSKESIAPPRRFSSARRALGEYARSGDSDSPGKR